MTPETVAERAREVRIDLCHQGGGGLNPDLYPRADYPATGVPADYFTCADQTNGINIWPCTGSKHTGGLVIICACACHKVGDAS